jgi:crotonobetainyl-CoA:carnitine CoA-transferase CaiB-like acyl-CoA transferase
MARPLRGLKVLDLGNFLAGPVVSMHLGAMGADVIKVERITGDDSRAIGPMAADGERVVLRAPPLIGLASQGCVSKLGL